MPLMVLILVNSLFLLIVVIVVTFEVREKSEFVYNIDLFLFVTSSTAYKQ